MLPQFGFLSKTCLSFGRISFRPRRASSIVACKAVTPDFSVFSALGLATVPAVRVPSHERPILPESTFSRQTSMFLDVGGSQCKQRRLRKQIHAVVRVGVELIDSGQLRLERPGPPGRSPA